MVARALESLRFEAGAKQLLLDHGFNADDVDQVLTHLSSPALTELEQLLVPLARETMWYQPAQIQRRYAEGVTDFGEKKEVTVLFADVAGFTALSESLEPNVLVGVLNGYFERMSDAISSHRGYVSTFIGDGLLAFFGAIDPNPWCSASAGSDPKF